MEVNPIMSGILAIAVFLLGLLFKQFKWDAGGKRMAWVIVGLSVGLGVVQAIVTSQLTPMPPATGGDPAEIIFVWLPKLLQWFMTAAVLILSFSQGIYFAIKKMLLAT